MIFITICKISRPVVLDSSISEICIKQYSDFVLEQIWYLQKYSYSALKYNKSGVLCRLKWDSWGCCCFSRIRRNDRANDSGERNFQHMHHVRLGDRGWWHCRLRDRPRDDHAASEYENGHCGEGERSSQTSNRPQQRRGARRHLLHSWKYEGKLRWTYNFLTRYFNSPILPDVVILSVKKHDLYPHQNIRTDCSLRYKKQYAVR